MTSTPRRSPSTRSAKDPTVFRSILFFSEQSEWSFGAEALRRYVEDGMRGRFLRSLKRFLPMASFEETRMGSQQRAPRGARSAFSCEKCGGEPTSTFACDVRRVLLGRPARFASDPAGRRPRRAAPAWPQRGSRASKKSTFAPSPSAAAYDFQSRLDSPKLVLVADFGGGTSDFTVARSA